MKTKILLPQNVFSRIFLSELNINENYDVEYNSSSLIAKKLVLEENSVGLIPTLDLLSFKDLYVSTKIGISFNALQIHTFILKKGRRN